MKPVTNYDENCEHINERNSPVASKSCEKGFSPRHIPPSSLSSRRPVYDATDMPVMYYENNIPFGYKYIKALGKGSYGRVELCEHVASGELVAIKFINKSLLRTSRQLDRVRKEVRILALLDHPYIVQLKQVLETNESILMILEYVPHGELFEFISSRGFLTNMEALCIFRQLLSAISYCHANCIIHRDLKPENILLSSDLSIKVADFGFGAVFGHVPLLTTFCGSPHYAAPEMLSGTPYSGPEVDIWSLGVILFVLLTGKLPSFSSNTVVMPSEATGMSPLSIELIRGMLCEDPNRRMKLTEIISHPWVRSVDVDFPHSFVPYREPISSKNINMDIVNYLCQSGYDKENILLILSQSTPHPLKAEYYLLLERNQKKLFSSVSKSSFPTSRVRSNSLQHNEHQSLSPVRKLLTRVSSIFTSSPLKTSHNNNRGSDPSLHLPLSSLPEAVGRQKRRLSMPTLYTSLPDPFLWSSDTSSSFFSSYNSVHSPRKVGELSSSLITASEKITIPELSLKLTSFLSKMGMVFSVRDMRNPYKMWCENRQTSGEFPPLAFTIEIIEISSSSPSASSKYGIECRRLCGGSWVVFRKLLTRLGQHLSSAAPAAAQDDFVYNL